MAISVVQTKTGTGSGTSIPATLTATGSGNALIVCVMNVGGSAATLSGITIGGSASNFASVVAAASGGVQTWIWACPSAPTGQTALAVNGSSFANSGGSAGVVAYEVSALAATLAVMNDKSSPGTGSGASWSSGASGALSQAAEFAAGCAASFLGTPAGPSSPWTNTSPSAALIAGQQVTSSASSLTYSGTGGSSTWAACVATFQGSALFPRAYSINQSVMRSAVW